MDPCQIHLHTGAAKRLSAAADCTVPDGRHRQADHCQELPAQGGQVSTYTSQSSLVCLALKHTDNGMAMLAKYMIAERAHMVLVWWQNLIIILVRTTVRCSDHLYVSSCLAVGPACILTVEAPSRRPMTLQVLAQAGIVKLHANFSASDGGQSWALLQASNRRSGARAYAWQDHHHYRRRLINCAVRNLTGTAHVRLPWQRAGGFSITVTVTDTASTTVAKNQLMRSRSSKILQGCP